MADIDICAYAAYTVMREGKSAAFLRAYGGADPLTSAERAAETPRGGIMTEALLLDGRTRSLVEEYVPQGEILEGLVDFFSIFADGTRLRILSALAISELCVTDISRVLGINQTTVSHQLRYLKNVGIVKAERLGKVIFYSLKNETVNDVLLKGVEFLGY